jgi:hypothetical protein
VTALRDDHGSSTWFLMAGASARWVAVVTSTTGNMISVLAGETAAGLRDFKPPKKRPMKGLYGGERSLF